MNVRRTQLRTLLKLTKLRNKTISKSAQWTARHYNFIITITSEKKVLLLGNFITSLTKNVQSFIFAQG